MADILASLFWWLERHHADRVRRDSSGENLMQKISISRTGDSNLRFVFSDAVFSCSLPGEPTFGDIAATLARLCGNRDCYPLSIAVTLAKPQTLSHSRK
jgi:hypothetical protein